MAKRFTLVKAASSRDTGDPRKGMLVPFAPFICPPLDHMRCPCSTYCKVGSVGQQLVSVYEISKGSKGNLKKLILGVIISLANKFRAETVDDKWQSFCGLKHE